MQNIHHLYWRAGFGLSPQEWMLKQGQTREEAVEELFQKASQAQPLPVAAPFQGNPRAMEKSKFIELRKQARRDAILRNISWIERMADDNQSALLERMSLFWHGHFACQVRSGRLVDLQLNAIRKHALGNFRDLVLAMAQDPAMIRFLNNQQNKKKQPNENFARELMELFTIGRGNYTENDVKEAARAFTGWSSNFQDEYVFRAFQHDYGSKTFMGKTGNFDGADIIDILLERRETASFIAEKIFRYFVNERIEPARVKELADLFYDSGYDIGKLMRHLFLSDWFYEAKNRGHKIKSPVEYIAGLKKKLKVEFEFPQSLIFLQRSLGQVLFNPPNVAGWPGGRSWIDNSTLMLRLNIGAYLMTNAEVQFKVKEEPETMAMNRNARKLKARLELSDLEKYSRSMSDPELFDFLRNFMIVPGSKIQDQVFKKVISAVSSDTERLRRALIFFTSLPEYQVC